MKAGCRILKPEDIPPAGRRTFGLDVLEGLSKKPKRIPPAYFYDQTGSELFREISGLEEYYITRCEYEILAGHRDELAGFLPREPFNLVELGAGDGRKTVLLLEHFLKSGFEFEYIPLDISADAIEELILTLEEKIPDSSLNVQGIVAEYFDGLKWLAERETRKSLVLFLGSNIGNFDRPGTRRFLQHLWNCLKPDDLALIGFDLKKNIDVLNGAYNDSRGVTRRFNFNLLERINRELGGNFDLDKFAFYSRYNVLSGAVESFLVSMEAQQVLVEDLEKIFSFEAWEAIHTESSYKFLESDIVCLAAEAGFVVERQFLDPSGYFADSLWRVVKPEPVEAGSCRSG